MARNAGKEIDNFVKTFLLAQRAWRDNDMADARRKYYEALTAKAKGEGQGGLSDDEFRSRMGVGGTGGSGGKGGMSTDPADDTLQPHQKAFLNAVAAPESGGAYDIRYTPKGGMKFSGYDAHPNILEPTADGRKSSAAGRYQFTGSTWRSLPAEVRGNDFAPKTQDRAAWFYGQQVYKQKTGRDLDTDLREKGLTPDMMRTLGPTWRGLADNPQKAIAAFNSSMKRYSQGGSQTASKPDAPAGTATEPAIETATVSQPANVPVPPRRPANLPGALTPQTPEPEAPKVETPGASDPETGALDVPKPAPEMPALPNTGINAIPLNLSEARVDPTTETAALETPEVPEPAIDVASAEFDPDFDFDLGFEFFAADGGMMPEQPQQPEMPDAPLDEALGAALRGVQNMYGLSRQGAALPGTDPNREQALSAMVRNEGAASPEQMKQLLLTVDPDGTMPRGLANAEVLQKLYAFHAQQGDTEGAERATAEALQAMRQRSMNLGALAGAALQSGDVQGAAKALIEAYNQVPDGRDVTGQVDQRGVGRAVVRDVRSGKVVQEMPITPQIMKVAVERLASGTEFYPHLASMARPSSPAPAGPGGGGIPAPRYAGGGAVEDDEYDVDAYGSANTSWDAEDAEAARAAAAVAEAERAAAAVAPVTTQGNQSTEEESGDGEEVTGALPVGERPAPPAQPRFIDTAGMNDQQRRVADAVNKQRLDLYKQDLQNYRQAVNSYGQDSRASARQAATDARTSARQDRMDDRADKRTAAQIEGEDRREKMRIEAERRKRAMEIAAEERKEVTTQRNKENDRQRERYNGMTEAEMRQEVGTARQNATVDALGLTAQETMRDKPRRGVVMPEGVGGPTPAIQAMALPEGVNAQRSARDVVSNIRGEFGREFARQPGDQARMIRTRDAGNKRIESETDETALDVGARAAKGDIDKDRLAELRSYFDAGSKKSKATEEPDDDGLFFRPNKKHDPRDPNSKPYEYYGNEIPRGAKEKIFGWATKLLGFNGDMPPQLAGRAVLEMVEVNDDKDGNPITTPNFSVKIDPRTGAGRVIMKDGLTSFNVDRETLRQLVTYRQADIEKRLAEKAKTKADNEAKEGTKWELSAARAEQGFNELVRRDGEKRAGAKLRQPGLSPLSAEDMQSVRDPRLRSTNALKQRFREEREALGIGN